MKWRKFGKKRFQAFHAGFIAISRPRDNIATILYAKVHCGSYVFLFVMKNESHRFGIGGYRLDTGAASIAYRESFVLYTRKKDLQSIADCFTLLIDEVGDKS